MPANDKECSQNTFERYTPDRFNESSIYVGFRLVWELELNCAITRMSAVAAKCPALDMNFKATLDQRRKYNGTCWMIQFLIGTTGRILNADMGK
jgi:hypothetical protein